MLTLIVLACALDGALKSTKDDATGDSAPPQDDSGGDPPGPDEPCDGLDNDGDGEHDEGWPDSDGDGTADCVDDACDLDGGAVVEPALSACLDVAAPVPSVDPWNIVELWEFRDPSGCRTYAAGDFDGDGEIEVICGGSRIHVLDARTGAVESSFGDAGELDAMPPAVAADVDGDGAWELYYLTADGRAVATTVDAGELWRSADPVALGPPLYEAPTIADVDGDGSPEFVGSAAILAAADGTTLAKFDQPRSSALVCDQVIAVEDVDLDGRQEVFVSWERKAADGSTVWRVAPPSSESQVVQPMIVQADDDPQGEILWMSDDGVLLVEADGTIIRSWPLVPAGAAGGGQPCVADLDGDGRSDVVMPLREELVASSLVGGELWRAPMYDFSPPSGCTIADLNGDRGPEVLLFDTDSFRILDGGTGQLLARVGGYAQGTANDLCLPLEVDGRTIVVCSLTAYDSDPTTRIALVAFDAVSGDWSGGTRVWGRSNWAGTQLREDGTVPARPASPWLVNGMYRGQPAVNATGIDLRVSIVDACAWSCDPTGASVSLLVENAGPESMSDVPLAVYGYDADGNRSTLRTMSANDVKPAGTSTVLTLDLTSSRAFVSIEVVVGELDGAILPYECAEDDNRAVWVLPCGE